MLETLKHHLECRRFNRDARRAVIPRLRHLAGPRSFQLGDWEVAAVCLGHNVSYFLPLFFEWHRAIGIERFLYIDNNSTDGSVDIAACQANTIVVACDLEFKLHQSRMRSAIPRALITGGWTAMIDADEMLDYPERDRLALPDFIRTGAADGATGFIGQMLDLFPVGDLRAFDRADFSRCVREYVHYELQSIRRVDYTDVFARWTRTNRIASDDYKFLFGGVRARMFGEDCCLTKHPLIRTGTCDIAFLHPHFSAGVRCSEKTLLIKHFKFAGDCMARDIGRRESDLVSHDEHLKRLSVFESGDEVVLFSENARTYGGFDELVDQKIVFT